MKYLFTILLLSCFISCKNNFIDVKNEISQLDTIEKRNAFLEDILKKDQGVRIEATRIEQETGYNSKESQDHYKLFMQADHTNMELISMYLDTFGFPDKEDYTSEARLAPYMVIHHTSSNKYRKKYFPMLYKAYKLGDFESLAFFLGRMHDVEFGYFMSFENPYTEDFEIAQLTSALGLTEIMKEIDQELKL